MSGYLTHGGVVESVPRQIPERCRGISRMVEWWSVDGDHGWCIATMHASTASSKSANPKKYCAGRVTR